MYKYSHRCEYKGITFKSKLERKWARYFDKLGWKWEYEPVMLKGWIPDFKLRFSGRDIIVEVKPIEISSKYSKTEIETFKEVRGDINRNVDKLDYVLLLGNGPEFYLGRGAKNTMMLGWKFSKDDNKFYPCMLTKGINYKTFWDQINYSNHLTKNN